VFFNFCVCFFLLAQQGSGSINTCGHSITDSFVLYEAIDSGTISLLSVFSCFHGLSIYRKSTIIFFF
jgi:hypothetical protein